MDKKDIYELMDRFDKSSLVEMELKIEGAKVIMKKGGRFITLEGNENLENINLHRISTSIDTDVNKVVSENVNKDIHNDENNEVNINEKTLKAPLVGTFYRAPSPDEEPYVKVGSMVKAGDVIGIIEAMKLMNEITATDDGEITSIEIENGEMVEYDQVILKYI